MKYLSYVVLIALIAVVNCNAQIAVIVNKSNPISKISQSLLSEIYLLNSTRWSDGTKIVVFDSKEMAVQKAMYSFIGKDNLSLHKRWMQVQLSGEGKAPEGLDDASDMLKRVASNPRAIGYVKLSEVRDSDVKVIAKME
jgi:ABC-type phosphate transport system substrate-binding protein